MKMMKRILCFLLCVVIMSGTVGTKYLDSNHMEKVEAAAETVAVGLSAAALYAICFYVGTVAYAHAPIEMNTLSDDQIASMGYSTISYMTANNLLGIPAAPNAPLIGFIDKAGQSYVFGSEAFKRVAETSFQVIQGGKQPDDDDNDDEGGIIDNLIKFPGNAKSLSGVCTAAFAAVLGSVIKDQYDKYMNGDVSIYQIPETGYFTDADILEQQKGGYTVNLSLYSQNRCDDCGKVVPVAYTGSFVSSSIPAVYVSVTSNRYNPIAYDFIAYDGTKPVADDITTIKYSCGHQKLVRNLSCSGNPYSSNIPVFDDLDALCEYVRTGEGYEIALNYRKEYRIADWLQDGWAGVLTDPLTGLQALGSWANIARHQGLSALGNELDLASFLNYLRDYFANLGQDPLPEADPAKAPVLYPSGDAEGALDPDTDIDPARKPVILPDPSFKPEPGIKPDPDPGTDPAPGVTPLPDMDAADYKVELTGVFPFCIPFDFIALLKALDASPRAPCFAFPVVIPALAYREDVELDLAVFDDVAKVIRLCEKVSFILFLMFVTSKVIRW